MRRESSQLAIQVRSNDLDQKSRFQSPNIPITDFTVVG